MSEEFSDELISAYLDGELSAGDRQRVEQRLLDSAEHRQMFKDLAALRDQLHALPKYTICDDFSSRVIQQINETTLAEPTTRTSPGPRPESRAIIRRMVWATVAIAATLLIAISLGNLAQHRNQQIVAARQPEDAGRTENHPAEEGIRESENEVATKHPSASKPATSHLAKSGELASFTAQGGAAAVAPSPAESLDQKESQTEPKDETYLIIVDVPQQSLDEREVDKALIASGIAMIDGRKYTADPFDEEDVTHLEPSFEKRDLRPFDSPIRRSRHIDQNKKLVDEKHTPAEFEVVVVNATAKQLAAVYASLKSQGYALATHHKSDIGADRGAKRDSNSPSRPNAEKKEQHGRKSLNDPIKGTENFSRKTPHVSGNKQRSQDRSDAPANKGASFRGAIKQPTRGNAYRLKMSAEQLDLFQRKLAEELAMEDSSENLRRSNPKDDAKAAGNVQLSGQSDKLAVSRSQTVRAMIVIRPISTAATRANLEEKAKSQKANK